GGLAIGGLIFSRFIIGGFLISHSHFLFASNHGTPALSSDHWRFRQEQNIKNMSFCLDPILDHVNDIDTDNDN
ncbi:MAG: hypothetical protein NWS54_03660, partial [Porticoccaceae bacterium]|nr:hypothetical protein [Porticoccaceae bacterium]